MSNLEWFYAGFPSLNSLRRFDKLNAAQAQGIAW
jgi:hypothetical protein